MENSSIISPIVNRIQFRNYQDFKGTNLQMKFAMKKALINFCLRTMITHSKGLKKFKTIKFDSIEKDKIVLIIDRKNYVKKTITGKIKPEIEFNHHDDPIIVIELKKGINLIEKGAIASVNIIEKTGKIFKTGWGKVRSFFGRREEVLLLEEPKPAYKLSPKTFKINLKQALKDSDMGYLNPLIKWNNIESSENNLSINFKIKL